MNEIWLHKQSGARYILGKKVLLKTPEGWVEAITYCAERDYNAEYCRAAEDFYAKFERVEE